VKKKTIKELISLNYEGFKDYMESNRDSMHLFLESERKREWERDKKITGTI